MKILNESAQRIRACVKLTYRGHEISLSNLMHGPSELRVFKGVKDVTPYVCGYCQGPIVCADSIRETMNAIDKMEDGQ